MFICVELSALDECLEWREVGATMLEITDLGLISAAIFGVFAVAFGFRMVFRMMFLRRF